MVTFIIPVYNCKNYIRNCVLSISKLTSISLQVEYEIILVDDGSTDGSGELCDTLAAQVKNTRVIHQENRGVSAARNAGIRMSQGQYVVFVDSDDTVDASMLANVIEKVISDLSIDMCVYGISFDYYNDEKVCRRQEFLPPLEGIYRFDDCINHLRDLFYTNSLSSLCTRIIKKSLIENNGIELKEDMFLYEDLEFSLRVLSHCEKVLFCRCPAYHYRQIETGCNVSKRLQRIEHIPDLLAQIENALSLLKVAKVDKDEILLGLYAVLIREKLSLCSKREMIPVCTDYKEWIQTKKLKSAILSDAYAMNVYNCNTMWLLINRAYMRIRHRVAIAIKAKRRTQ